MLLKKKNILNGIVSCLFCFGYSFDSIAMDRSLSPGTTHILSTFHKGNDLNEIKNSIKTIDSEHGIRLYGCGGQKGQKYVLKSNGRCYGNYSCEKMAFELFNKNKPGINICAPCYCDEYSYDTNHRKYYVIYPYVENIDEHTLFKFINYSDYKEENPSKLRTFDERKNIWIDLVNQLINMITCLFNYYKILHCDWAYDNILFNVDEGNKKLIATLIDFDTACEVKYASPYDFERDLFNFCGCLIKDCLLPMFYECDKSYNKNNECCLDLDNDSDNYFSDIKSYLEEVCKLINISPPKTSEEYFSYIKELKENLID